MRRYLIPITNRETGEQIVVDLVCAHPVEAQVTALHNTFHQYGWRRLEAGPAVAVEEDQAA